MSRRIDAWAVLSDYTASDHLYIGFVIRGSEEKNVHRARKYIRWCHKKIDEDIFKETLEWSCIRTPSQELTAEESGHEIRVLSQMHATQPCLVLGAYIEIVYWWNDHIAELRRICLGARKKWQRLKGR